MKSFKEIIKPKWSLLVGGDEQFDKYWDEMVVSQDHSAKMFKEFLKSVEEYAEIYHEQELKKYKDKLGIAIDETE